MTEIKKIEGFTPGPWVVENGGQDLWIGTGKNEGTKVDDIVVHIENGTEYKESVRLKNHANSDLIAYAPTLYSIALDQQKEINEWRKEATAAAQLRNEHLEEIERLKGLLKKSHDKGWCDAGDSFMEDSWQQFKTDNNL